MCTPPGKRYYSLCNYNIRESQRLLHQYPHDHNDSMTVLIKSTFHQIRMYEVVEIKDYILFAKIRRCSSQQTRIYRLVVNEDYIYVAKSCG